jgi:hypothetical protein
LFLTLSKSFVSAQVKLTKTLYSVFENTGCNGSWNIAYSM